MMPTIDRLKEAQILRRIQKGDDAAFTEAYDIYAPKLWKHAYYRTGAKEHADDILSETFLKAWEFVRERSKEIQHLRAFLYRVSNNLIIDHYRRNARAPIPMDEDIERTLSDDTEIELDTDLKIESEKMRQALLTLKIDVRELLVMRFIDDLTIEEISIATGKTKNAVYVSIHRAVKELKNVCSEITISIN